MLTKRIIPCLDVKDGRVVKGVYFEDLQDVGDPVTLARRYAQEGADELVFLDITATVEGRRTLVELVATVAAVLDIPFTVGGGISTLEQVGILLHAGVDKISVNSAALKNPDLINAIADHYGSQCVVVAIDARTVEGRSVVHSAGGRIPTEKETVAWAQEAAQRGAGEILLTSMDHDGTRQGFADELTAAVAAAVPIPVIASGGGGAVADFTRVLTTGGAHAALAASIFHYQHLTVGQLKEQLHAQGVPIRRITP